MLSSSVITNFFFSLRKRFFYICLFNLEIILQRIEFLMGFSVFAFPFSSMNWIILIVFLGLTKTGEVTGTEVSVTTNTNITNGKMMLNGPTVVIIKNVDGDPRNASDSFNDLTDVEGLLNGTGLDSSNACRNLNVFICMKRNCKWMGGKCNLMDTNNTTLPSFPKSLDELTETFQLMWDNPPSNGNPEMWLIFLGSGITVVTLIVLGLLFRLIRWCGRRYFRKESKEGKEIRRFLGKRLVLGLPNGRKIPIGEYTIDATEDEPRIIITPSKTSETAMLGWDVVESPEPGHRYDCSKIGINGVKDHGGDCTSRTAHQRATDFDHSLNSVEFGYPNDADPDDTEECISDVNSEQLRDLMGEAAAASASNMLRNAIAVQAHHEMWPRPCSPSIIYGEITKESVM